MLRRKVASHLILYQLAYFGEGVFSKARIHLGYGVQNEVAQGLARKDLSQIDRYKELEAKKNALNSVLKTMFETYGVSKYTSSDDISITISKKPNVSFDEVKLLHYCKGLSIDGLVKQKEYVDMTVLEESIYRDASIKESIKGFKIVKPDTVTLRCTQKKKLNE